MSRYQNRTAVLATMHAKEQAIAPPLRALGLSLFVPAALDTDTLGTFSGEVERPGSPFEVVIRKARLGMAQANMTLGLASEGSFRSNAWVEIGNGGHEILAFVDAERNVEIVEELRDVATNFANRQAGPDDDLDAFLERVGFPDHALIVSPNSVASAFRTRRIQPGEVIKGIRDRDALRRPARRGRPRRRRLRRCPRPCRDRHARPPQPHPHARHRAAGGADGGTVAAGGLSYSLPPCGGGLGWGAAAPNAAWITCSTPSRFSNTSLFQNRNTR